MLLVAVLLAPQSFCPELARGPPVGLDVRSRSLHSRQRILMGGFGGKEEVNPGRVKGTALRILEYPHPLLREGNADVVDFDYKVRRITRKGASL